METTNSSLTSKLTRPVRKPSFQFDLFDYFNKNNRISGKVYGKDTSVSAGFYVSYNNDINLSSRGYVNIKMNDSILPTKNGNLEQDIILADTSVGISKDTVKLTGKSMLDYDVLTGMTKPDIVKVKLGEGDSLIVGEVWATRQTTDISVGFGVGSQTLNIKDLNISPWYRSGQYMSLIKNLRI